MRRPSAHADGSQLKSALDDYAAGKLEDALKKLTEYVASNPGDDEVYGVLRSVDETVKLRALAAGGERERLMRYLLDKAKPVVEAKKRNPDRIKQLVEQRPRGRHRRAPQGGARTRDGLGRLRRPLPPARTSATPRSEKVVNAMFALHDIGAEAVLPLAEALNSGDARLRKYVAAVLGDLKDPRALPALRKAVEKDADGDVKAKAADSIRRIRPDGAASTAAASYVKLGQMYYAGEPSVISELDQVHNLWVWEGDALARYEVPAGLYNYVLAERHAAEALALDAGNLAARSLLVRATLAQALEGRAMGDKAPRGAQGRFGPRREPGLRRRDSLRSATRSPRTRLGRRRRGRAASLAATYGGQDLAGTAIEQALSARPSGGCSTRRPIAALRMSPSKPFANSAPGAGARRPRRRPRRRCARSS